MLTSGSSIVPSKLCEERVLALAAGAGRAAEVQLDRPLERFTLPPVRAGDRFARGCEVEEIAERGLVDDVGELVRGEDLREVDEHPRDAGDGDAVEHA